MATHSSVLAWKIHGHRWATQVVGYSPWGCKELDTTESLTLTQGLQRVGEGGISNAGSQQSGSFGMVPRPLAFHSTFKLRTPPLVV